MSNTLEESALGTIGDLFGAPETPEPEPAPEPDPEDDLELAPAAELDLGWDDDPEDDPIDVTGLDDLSDDELRAQVVKAKREAEYQKSLRVQTGIKAWRAEAAQKFPYSSPDKIQTESRREFLRLAQAEDAAFRGKAQPLLDSFKTREAKLRETLTAEIRAEVEAAWGTPTLGGGPSAPLNAGPQDRLASARKRRSLKDVALALADSGSI